MMPTNPLTLADWRRQVAETYSAVRESTLPDGGSAWDSFRKTRDRLFKTHPQSPLSSERRARFSNLDYYPYDPAWRLVGVVDAEVERKTFCLDLPAEGLFRYTLVGLVRFSVEGQDAALNLYWVEGYGGGLFLPFKDTTCGRETYGGGRYLYDTIKGADLGAREDEIVLDFNYAYNPSCAYSAEWICPLSPHENTLSFPVEAGEKNFD